MSLWDVILKTNTFNFAILLLIFAVIFSKLNVMKIIEQLKQDIISSIENAKSEKISAENSLKSAVLKSENLENEIKDRQNIANEKAIALRDEIIKNAQKTVNVIDANIEKMISAEEKTYESKMFNDTLRAASDIARAKLIQKLKENPNLHNQFIERSIEAI